MISSLIESLLESIDKLLSDGRISWGAVITALLFFNKINKYKEFRARDKRVELRQLRIESKVDDLMRDRGVVSTWSFQENGSNQGDQSRFRKLYLSLQAVIIRRRKQIMDKLKSRKLWMAIFGALLPIINEEFNLGLNTDTVIASVVAIVGYVLGQAHVDAKKAEGGPDAKPTINGSSDK